MSAGPEPEASFGGRGRSYARSPSANLFLHEAYHAFFKVLVIQPVHFLQAGGRGDVYLDQVVAESDPKVNLDGYKTYAWFAATARYPPVGCKAAR